MKNLVAVPKIVAMIFFILLIILASLIIYKILYNIKINKQLQSGNTNGKQWPAPKTIVTTVALIFLSIFCITLYSNNNKSSITYNANQYTDYRSYTSEEIIGTVYEQYTHAFETGELPGYEKFEKTESDVHYMYFKSKKSYDILHPSFIIFVEYVGDQNIVSYSDESRIYYNQDNSFGSAGGGNATNFYCVVGNMDLNKYMGFNYNIAFYCNMEDLFNLKNEGFSSNDNAVARAEIWIN